MSLSDRIFNALNGAAKTDAELALECDAPIASVRRSRGQLVRTGLVAYAGTRMYGKTRRQKSWCLSSNGDLLTVEKSSQAARAA